MPHPFHGLCDGLLVQNAACSKLHIHPKPLLNKALQNLDLHLSHDLYLYLPCGLVPADAQLRLFLFQGLHVQKHLVDVAVCRKDHLVRQDRLQKRYVQTFLSPQSLAGKGLCRPRDRAHRSGLCLRNWLKLGSGVNADLIHLLPGTALLGPQLLFDLQAPSGYFHMGETVSLGISGYLKNPCGKFIPVNRRLTVPLNPFQQFPYPVLP